MMHITIHASQLIYFIQIENHITKSLVLQTTFKKVIIVIWVFFISTKMISDKLLQNHFEFLFVVWCSFENLRISEKNL